METIDSVLTIILEIAAVLAISPTIHALRWAGLPFFRVLLSILPDVIGAYRRAKGLPGAAPPKPKSPLSTPPFLPLLCLAFLGCNAQQKVETVKVTGEAMNCRAKISLIIQEAPSCSMADQGIRKLIREDPMCKELFQGTGFGLNCGAAL